MNRKHVFGGIALLVLLIAAPIGWYLLSPLFITRTVDESFPAAQVAQAAPQNAAVQSADQPAAPASAAPVASAAASAEPSENTPASGEKSQAPALDAMQPTEPKVLRTGQFHDVAHEGVGTATIYELPDGKLVLRLENFEVLNGPDLKVYVSAAPDANDEQAIIDAGFVSLGELKGNKGNQNYELPADFDLTRANSVTIWCEQFSVNFATAPLT